MFYQRKVTVYEEHSPQVCKAGVLTNYYGFVICLNYIFESDFLLVFTLLHMNAHVINFILLISACNLPILSFIYIFIHNIDILYELVELFKFYLWLILLSFVC